MPDYLAPRHCCDLIMKGGITSGVLYPSAIARIAEGYYLVGIGGTSAGAIAASVAAAAEYRRRRNQDGRGFELLEELPDDLAGEGKLTSLFRPDSVTKNVYELFLDFLTIEQRGWLGRLWLKARGLWAAVGVNKRLRPVVENGFGLCSGMANGNRPGPGEIAPLTEWLAEQIDSVAGKTDGQPLTFADLHNAPIPQVLADTMRGHEGRSIDFRAVTTCVTFGRPYELPFDTNIFAFDVQEWRRLFPKKVMDYLEEAAGKVNAPSLKRDGRLPLPTGGAMPVVVAARMSLSFPGLFSMIPLYAVNYHAPDQPGGVKPMMKVWFSDGGITSNLPIHRFDSIFPRWPTLGINLQYTDEHGKPARSSVDSSLVHMIKRRSDGASDLWNIFDGRSSAIKNMFGFVGAIFNAAQTWHDNAFLRLPGFRDRVVEIWLKPDEGGLNLAMPTQTIKTLMQRGNKAGIELRDRFLNTPPDQALSWDGHRWARLRSGLAGLATALHDFKQSVKHPMPDDRTLAALLETVDSPPAYAFDESAQQFTDAKQAINDLLRYVESIERLGACANASDKPYCGGPRPVVEIGSRAPL